MAQETFFENYALWKKHTNIISWADLLDGIDFKKLDWSESIPKYRGNNSKFYGSTQWTSIDLQCWCHWQLCGAKPVVVKQFGKEVTLGAEYYFKKIEKQMRRMLQHTWKKYKKDSVDRDGYYYTMPIPKIQPIHKDPGQLNRFINFAIEEYQSPVNQFGQKHISWDQDFIEDTIALSQKATEAMNKELMFIKIKVK